MNRTIIIKESVKNKIIGNILKEAFAPNTYQVKAIKKYLDDNFVKSAMDDIDDKGYPTKKPYVAMLSAVGGQRQTMKWLTPEELVVLLDDKFNSFINDTNDRRKFLQQVVTDWFNNKIDNNGMLSTNYIK